MKVKNVSKITFPLLILFIFTILYSISYLINDYLCVNYLDTLLCPSRIDYIILEVIIYTILRLLCIIFGGIILFFVFLIFALFIIFLEMQYTHCLECYNNYLFPIKNKED